jgi:lipid A 3-O-deacylase
MQRWRMAVAAALVLMATLGLRPAAAQEPAFLAVGVGAFDAMESEFRAAQAELQYRSQYKLWIFNPMLGANVNSDKGVYGYAGLSIDIFLGNRLVVRPSIAPGLYAKGDGKDLGHVVEFRSGLELSWRFDDRSRLGMELSHRSNASLDKSNPGEESLMVFYHLPLSRLTGR